MNRRHPSAGAPLPGDTPSGQPSDKPRQELTGALAAALARTLRPTQPPAPAAPPQPRAARRVPTTAWQAPKPRTAPAPRAEGTPAPAPRPRKAPKPRRPSVRVDGLQDLATITRQLREQRERAEAEEKARREAAARLEAERQLFSRAVGQVHPLTDRNLAELPTTPPEPLPLQHWLDEERVLMESISDDFDVSSLLDTDDQLSFRRPGIGPEVVTRLRRGHWSIQGQIDLHGLRRDEARDIRVYLRDVPNSSYKSFYAVTQVKTRLTTVVAVLSDVTAMPEWIARMKSVKLLQRTADSELWVHARYRLPYPFLEREAVLQSLGKLLFFEGTSLPVARASWQSERRLRLAIKGTLPGQVDFLAERAGLKLTGVRRLRLGRIGLDGLPSGQWRYLAAQERF